MKSENQVGFIGLGKLGLPCAAALSVKSKKKIYGYDVNPQISNYIRSGSVPYMELGMEKYLPNSDIELVGSIKQLVEAVNLLFVAVQTPHEKIFEGTTPVPNITRDFDYSFLKNCIGEIASALRDNPNKKLMIVVISTVLPGTMRKEVLPLLAEFGDRIEFCYNPFFIAMGTTINDYLNPEFILIGSDNNQSALKLKEFYNEFIDSPCKCMKIESAELTKVAYNTFIGFKIVFANTLAEITSIRGGDVDEITSALSDASVRLMSEKYLSAGMGDGGGCHPRDQIAMSWLASDANISADIFGWLARARDSQTKRQAELLKRTSEESGLPIKILGQAYKANINLTVGSPALLLSSILQEMGVPHSFYDPNVNPGQHFENEAAVFFVATNHDIFQKLKLPQGSICIDPWGNAVSQQPGLTLLTPGRNVEI